MGSSRATAAVGTASKLIRERTTHPFFSSKL